MFDDGYVFPQVPDKYDLSWFLISDLEGVCWINTWKAYWEDLNLCCYEIIVHF